MSVETLLLLLHLPLVLIPSLHSTERRCRALRSRPRSPSHGANREEGSERGRSEE